VRDCQPSRCRGIARAFAVAMKRAAGGSDDAKLVDLERFRRDHGGAK
jgi:hypothetical protein